MDDEGLNEADRRALLGMRERLLLASHAIRLTIHLRGAMREACAILVNNPSPADAATQAEATLRRALEDA